MFEVVLGLVAPVLGLVAVLGARSWAEESVAAEERFFGDRLRDGQRRRRLVFGTTVNVVVGTAMIVGAGLWWVGLVEVGEEAPARSGPQPASDASWLLPAIFVLSGAAAVFIVVMLVLRFRQARRFRRGQIDGARRSEATSAPTTGSGEAGVGVEAAGA